MKAAISLSLAFILCTACGAGKDKAPDDKDNSKSIPSTVDANSPSPLIPADVETAGSSALVDDQELSGAVISSQVDDAASAVAEGDAGSSATLGLADDSESPTETRNCEEQDEKALVTVERSREFSRSYKGPLVSGDFSIKGSYQTHRTWSKEGAKVQCDATKQFAAIDLNAMDGLHLDLDFSRQRSRTATFSNSRTGKTMDRSYAYEASGERHLVYASVKDEQGKSLLQRTVTSKVERKIEVKNSKGEDRVIDLTVSTAAEKPLVVLVDRNVDTGELASRTLKSGTLVAQHADGGRVELKFDNVVFTPGEGCVARTGKIEGAIYKKDESEPGLTYTLTMSEKGGEIAFSNGKTFDYVPAGCDLN